MNENTLLKSAFRWYKIKQNYESIDFIHDLACKYELVLNPFNYSIYFYTVFVQLQPQQYKFLYNILTTAKTGIKDKELMNLVYKDKKYKSRNNTKTDLAKLNPKLEQKLKTKKKKVAPVKIISSIKSKILKSIVWERGTKPAILSKLYEEREKQFLQNNKKKAKEINKQIDIIKNDWFKQNQAKILANYKMPIDLVNKLYIMDYSETTINGYKYTTFNVRNHIDSLLYVKDKTYFTKYKKARKASIKVQNKKS